MRRRKRHIQIASLRDQSHCELEPTASITVICNPSMSTGKLEVGFIFQNIFMGLDSLCSDAQTMAIELIFSFHWTIVKTIRFLLQQKVLQKVGAALLKLFAEELHI